ncbi:hypothetical protein PP568_18535 [Mycobacteroides abscessus]|uniref:Bacteriophage protein n=1 Tax=Mycobacteroides abscessus subsp. abscessus TaxID=1185650 RepID=A0AB38D3Q2_9MYCO|nr:hypothetical protein [Mycobacteroides abscessus]QSM03211.1 hypothetical protein PROPHIGD102-2_5 [Mycobacterium phage prophi102-2]QSM03979.1 hypothetical protein PROPHIGD54-1_5 [Mycobacterium phage prophiGD54-1]MBE5455110.1 hypothetical protein [Mycobacteroides abscessus]MBN7296713.1 hypothetical protein [Mycobacteroides abscessus subsp. abscessus]MBN7328447.1 hypothetical protein [Mycobacteroides abscessus subsp. abscessus]
MSTDGNDEVGQEPTLAGRALLDETAVAEAHPTAWADSDVEEPALYDDSDRRNWLISGVVFAVTAAVAALAAGGAYVFLRQSRTETPPPTAPVAAPSVSESKPLPSLPTSAVAPPPKRSLPPAPVALPTQGGIVYVGTQSRKTACEVTPGTVTCNVQFVISTPIRYGIPANVVTISAVGELEWGIGDRGQQQYRALDYGKVYRAFGWTITPTTEGTTFMNDATAHGMTVSVEGVMPF